MVSSKFGTSAPQIWVIDVTDWQIVDRIGVAVQSGDLAVGSDGTLYVAEDGQASSPHSTSRIVAIDPRTKHITKTIALPDDTASPRKLAVGSGGRLLYVEATTDAGRFDPRRVAVHIIDTARAEVVASQAVPTLSAYFSPDLVASPIDDFAYLIQPGDRNCGNCPAQVWVITPASEAWALEIAASFAAFSADGAIAYLWNGGRWDSAAPTSVVDTARQTAVDALPGGHIVAVSDDGCVIIAEGRSTRRACPGDTESVPLAANELSPESVTLAAGNGLSATLWRDGDCQAPPVPCNADSVCLEVVGGSGAPGESAELAVRLHSHGHVVAGTQNELFLDDALRLAAEPPNEGGERQVACRVNPAINKAHSAWGCIEADDLGCLVTRALVLALDNVDPITDGALLYTCTVAIPAGAEPGGHRVVCADPGASDPDGHALPIRCEDGEIVVTRHAGAIGIEGSAQSGASGCEIGAADADGFALTLAVAVLVALMRNRPSRAPRRSGHVDRSSPPQRPIPS